MSTSNIPSLGGFTPIESLVKGGSAKELFNPINIWNDGASVLQKAIIPVYQRDTYLDG